MTENSVKQRELEAGASIEEEELYSGRIFQLKRETLQIGSAPPHIWDLIRHPGATAVLPIQNNGNVVLLKQWRRAINKIIYEIVAGLLEEGEDPKAGSLREMQEEAGYKAGRLTPLGGLYSAPGFCNEYIHLFLGTELEKSSLPQDLHEGIDVVEMPLDDALSLIDQGEINDAKTICALLRYQRILSQNA